MARLYDDLLEIACTYMGIAGKEYLDRRCRIVARDTRPEDIGVEKIDRLVAGIEMTARVYMSVAKADAFRREVAALQRVHDQ
jgi:hypothetical protein